jgi:signal peptidase complex subunit 3
VSFRLCYPDEADFCRNVPNANFTLHYSLMPYVGILSSGVAATAQGPVTIPEALKR